MDDLVKLENKMASKEDLKGMASKYDLKRMASKEDIKGMDRKEDIKDLKDIKYSLIPHVYTQEEDWEEK